MKYKTKHTLAERFWLKVRKRRNGCWEWQASIGNHGYGMFGINNKMYTAHRVSWIIANGEIAKGDDYHGICVLHKCDNKLCVNPDHLFLGTNKDNVADMYNKGRDKESIGYKHSEETKIKLSNSLTGRKLSEKHKQNIGAASAIRTHSLESRLKMSIIAKQRKDKL